MTVWNNTGASGAVKANASGAHGGSVEFASKSRLLHECI